MTTANNEQPSFSRQFLPDRDSVEYEAQARARVLGDIRRLGLERHMAALEADGFTVLAPGEVAPQPFIDMVREKTLAIAERRFARSFDRSAGTSHDALDSPFGQVQFEPCLLEEDPIFETVLMNERALALITALLGESCVLCHFSTMVKGPGQDYLPLHADQNQSSGPGPFPAYAQVANATWALTDYTVDNGCIAFAPGSHRLCRPPTHAEATDLSNFVPLEVPAGSVIVWHGNTWHGAFHRTAPGLRVSIVCYFNRWYHYPIDGLRSRPSSEMVARNGARFATLTGANHPAGIDPLSSRARAMRTGLFA